MELAKIVASVDTLPPTAQLLPRLQGMLTDETTDIASLAGLVKVDVGLATEIVRVSNSALYGGGEAKGLEEAINRLGFSEIFRIASTIAAKSALAGPLDFYHMASGRLWNDSIGTAVFMENLAMSTEVNADTAYTIGLMHGIGKLIINAHFSKSGMEVYGDEEDPGPEMERRLLGWDHAQVGAEVLKNWKFPHEVHEPIRCQFAPAEAEGQTVAARLLELCRRAIAEDSQLTEGAISTPSEEDLGQICVFPADWDTALEDARLGLESLASTLGTNAKA